MKKSLIKATCFVVAFIVVIISTILVAACPQLNTTEALAQTQITQEEGAIITNNVVSCEGPTFTEPEHEIKMTEPEHIIDTAAEGEGWTTIVVYPITALNLRLESNVNCEILTVLEQNQEINLFIYYPSNWQKQEWCLVEANGLIGYVKTEYLSDVPVEEDEVVTSISGMHYYGLYSNEWWNFTPEEIDNAWNYKTAQSRPVLPTGTTRAWQSYLYSKLAENDVTWWYKYAVAQAAQESGFNPLNSEGTDWGLFSFRHYYWNSAYGDIFDYHANINAYVDRILPYLRQGESMDTIYMALSQHYNPTGQIYWNYVGAVLGRLNELWICD